MVVPLVLNATGDHINTDPTLLRWGDGNGGGTMTHALLIGSPAIDMGKDLSGTGQDQRVGTVRMMTRRSRTPPAGMAVISAPFSFTRSK